MVDSKENYKFGLEVTGLNKHTVKPNKYNTKEMLTFQSFKFYP